MGFRLASLMVDIGANTRGFDAAVAGVHRNLGKLLLVGGAAAGGLAFGLAKSIQAASNLRETVDKTKQVFGDSSALAVRAADEMAAKYGVVKQEFLDAASSIGLIGQAAGMTGRASAELGVHFSKVAADAASFYNIPMETSLRKIQAGLVGQVRPLRELGVLLSDNALKQEATRMGLRKGKEELDDATKVQVRAVLITRGLAAATGDLERTHGTFANQARRFWGGLTNTMADLGTRLMPVGDAILQVLNKLVGAAAHVVEKYGPQIGAFAERVAFDIRMAAAAFEDWPTAMRIASLVIREKMLQVGEVTRRVSAIIVAESAWAAETMMTLFGNVGNVIVGDVPRVLQAFARMATGVIAIVGQLGAAIETPMAAVGQFIYQALALGFKLFVETAKSQLMVLFEVVKIFAPAVGMAMDKALAELKKLGKDFMKEADFSKIGEELRKGLKPPPAIDWKVFADLPNLNPAIQAELDKLRAMARAAAPGPAVAGEPRPRPLPDEAEAAGTKSRFFDVIEYAKHLQEGILGKNSAAEKTANNTAEIKRLLEEAAARAARGAIVGALGVAAGPA